MKRKKLPVGIENFEEFFTEDFYYVDKTMFIAELLQNWGKVNLFTRPRRFGKSLNMSMLKCFFEIGCDQTLFHGLKIEQEKRLCEEYMGRFPVISISLKSVDGPNFKTAAAALRTVIGNEARRFSWLSESNRLEPADKELYQGLTAIKDGMFTMADMVLTDSLRTLSRLLFKHYGHKVILLIDEYDVPLDKAFQAGYYDEMVSLIRNMFGNALKTNDDLYFTVLTGCLRISKESIFTGLKETTHADSARINRFCAAFPEGDVSVIQDMLHDYLWDSISVRDTAVRMSMKENFYHGMVLGLLRSQENWLVQSNAESGEGCSDIAICTPERTGIVIELKYAENGNLEAACEKALKQIEERKYAVSLQRRGMKKIIKYGIAFCEKECMVGMSTEEKNTDYI